MVFHFFFWHRWYSMVTIPHFLLLNRFQYCIFFLQIVLFVFCHNQFGFCLWILFCLGSCFNSLKDHIYISIAMGCLTLVLSGTNGWNNHIILALTIFKKNLFILGIWMFFLHLYVYRVHVWCLRMSEKVVTSLEATVSDGCELPCRC